MQKWLFLLLLYKELCVFEGLSMQLESNAVFFCRKIILYMSEVDEKRELNTNGLIQIDKFHWGT